MVYKKLQRKRLKLPKCLLNHACNGLNFRISNGCRLFNEYLERSLDYCIEGQHCSAQTFSLMQKSELILVLRC